MTDVIGKILSIGEEILKSEGYRIEIIKTISDKQKNADTMIIIRQKKLRDNIIELTISNFKMEI